MTQILESHTRAASALHWSVQKRTARCTFSKSWMRHRDSVHLEMFHCVSLLHHTFTLDNELLPIVLHHAYQICCQDGRIRAMDGSQSHSANTPRTHGSTHWLMHSQQRHRLSTGSVRFRIFQVLLRDRKVHGERHMGCKCAGRAGWT
jgi:hypothetical protein